jgi:hypothetical protein
MLQIKSYEDYIIALESTPTEMFWWVPDDVKVLDSFKFNVYFSYDNEYDRKMNHVFLNGEHYDGIVLFSKHRPISKKEFDYRFLIERKEWNVMASVPKPFCKFRLETYDDYKNALEKTTTEMFWGIWPNVDIVDESIFDLYFSYHNRYDRHENHVFKHLFRNSYTYTNGIVLLSKNKKITEKEFVHRFLIEKKEHDILASKTKPYDIVFISYNEPNAEENFTKLSERFPRARRVHGIKGIHQAHIRAAESCSTEMFWVVDGDAVIDESFEFDHEVSTYERETVHVWRSRNPVNGLIYGHGGVKLLPRHLTLSMDTSSTDMTTSISKLFKPINKVSNISRFNTDPFNTWKSAFRECVKLSSKVIDRQQNEETVQRLKAWCEIGLDRAFGKYSIEGARTGMEYGNTYKDDPAALKKINDFDWLERYFKDIYGR